MLITDTKLKVKKLESNKIAIASDHAGYYLKVKLLDYLIKEKYDIKDLGTSSPESVDYPDFGHPLANVVAAGEFRLGISICGTGNGINMVVNKHPGIRAALCWNEEICRLARAHNDANILTLPGWFITESEAYLIAKTFLTTSFEGGRHARRIEKISLKIY
jgi:ribose 5-phosphate isomerase B